MLRGEVDHRHPCGTAGSLSTNHVCAATIQERQCSARQSRCICLLVKEDDHSAQDLRVCEPPIHRSRGCLIRCSCIAYSLALQSRPLPVSDLTHRRPGNMDNHASLVSSRSCVVCAPLPCPAARELTPDHWILRDM